LVRSGPAERKVNIQEENELFAISRRIGGWGIGVAAYGSGGRFFLVFNVSSPKTTEAEVCLRPEKEAA